MHWPVKTVSLNSLNFMKIQKRFLFRDDGIPWLSRSRQAEVMWIPWEKMVNFEIYYHQNFEFWDKLIFVLKIEIWSKILSFGKKNLDLVKGNYFSLNRNFSQKFQILVKIEGWSKNRNMFRTKMFCPKIEIFSKVKFLCKNWICSKVKFFVQKSRFVQK